MNSNPPDPLPPVVNAPDTRGLELTTAKAPQHAPTGNAAASNTENKNPLLHSRGLILGLLFGVTAALGLPILWMSPVFTSMEKWIWSVVVLIYTAILLAIAGLAIYFAVSMMN